MMALGEVVLEVEEVLRECMGLLALEVDGKDLALM